MSDSLKICRGLNCTSTKLIEAHIVPRAIGKVIRGGGPNLQLTMSGGVRQAYPQLGEYDPGILCEYHDGKLGVFDDYAVRVCRDFPATHRKVVGTEMFEMENFDGDRFAKFILAVLWRASITTRPNFRCVSLGPRYERLACDILFDAQPLSAFSAFQVLVTRYTSDRVDTSGLYSLPVRSGRDHHNCYWFSFGGFRVDAKVDARRWPREIAPIIANGNDVLRGLFVRLEDTTEFGWMADIVAQQMRHEAEDPEK